jgi:CheY-like chemotaxis protein
MHSLFQRFTRSPARLLIVEPNPTDAQALVARLKPLYRLETVTSGHQALERLASFQPEVVITELDLPDFSGIELIQRARSLPQHRHIVWVAVGYRRAFADKVASFRAGATEHLVKPLDLQTLPALLRSAYHLHDLTEKLTVS